MLAKTDFCFEALFLFYISTYFLYMQNKQGSFREAKHEHSWKLMGAIAPVAPALTTGLISLLDSAVGLLDKQASLWKLYTGCSIKNAPAPSDNY